MTPRQVSPPTEHQSHQWCDLLDHRMPVDMKDYSKKRGGWTKKNHVYI